jgi:hypothetical protein
MYSFISLAVVPMQTVEDLVAQLAAERAKTAALQAELAKLVPSGSSSSASTAVNASASVSAQSASQPDESTKAFTSQFINDNRVPERLFEHLNRAADPKNINYVALVQGSGHGKTRSIIETCRQYQLVSVYMCFRAMGSSGFPIRGHQVGNVLQRMNAGEDAIGKLLSCILFAVESRLLKLEGSEAATFHFRPFGLDEAFGIDESFWSDAMQCQHCNSHGPFTTDRLNHMLDRINSQYARQSLKFVFIWDEARALIYSLGSANVAHDSVSAFRQLRRVIMKTPYDNTVSVFLDTSSMVTNFLPVLKDDQSSREFARTYLPPFIHVGQSPEALVTHASSSSSEASSMHLTRETQLALRGRALWFSYHRAGRSLGYLVQTACGKFNTESLESGVRDATSMAAACAITAAVAQMDIVPLSSLASDLVHSHLATLVAVSEDRREILVGYPSEPIVARAAVSLLSSTTHQCERVLEEVARALSHGLTMTTAGAAGEFVSRMYLLLHRDIPLGDMTVVVPKETVEHYLSSLIGSNRIDVPFFLLPIVSFIRHCFWIVSVEFLSFPGNARSVPFMQQNADCANATISFTHFTTLMDIHKLSIALLDESYHAGLALICPPNQKGADLIIPVRLHNGQFTAIFGQVKNYAKPPATSLAQPATVEILPSQFLADNHPLFALEPIMTLYHQVGVLEGGVTSQTRHLSITGLGSAHLDSSISNKLFEICNTRVDARASIWVTSLDCGSSLHNYFPLAYPAVGNSAGAVRFDPLVFACFRTV